MRISETLELSIAEDELDVNRLEQAKGEVD